MWEDFGFPYEKISEDSQRWSLEPAMWRKLQRLEWVVTEKLHGANFCVVSDGEQLRCAKRKAFLEAGESFFGHERLLSKLTDCVLSLTWELQEADPTIRVVQVFGELYGGNYPHPEVSPVQGVEAVQTGVAYRPDLGFSVFDIACIRARSVESDVEKGRGGLAVSMWERRYLGVMEMRQLALDTGLEVVPLLAQGSMQEAISFDPCFSSRVPALLGLPGLPWSNQAEGVVLRPAVSFTWETPKGLVRPLLKRKPAAFSEDARYHQATHWSPSRPLYARREDVEGWKQRIEELAQPTRLANAISKVGRVRPGDDARKEQVMLLLQEDILAALREESPGAWERLPSQAQHQLACFLESSVRALFVDVVGG